LNWRIKKLLTELQAAIETENTIKDEEKIDFLEQVKILAEAAQEFGNQDIQKIVKNAINCIKGMLSDLPPSTAILSTCSQVLPLIITFFGM
jgi:DNA replication initiation complex subunit (GINS family)